MTRIAEHPPSHCSSCFGAGPDLRYIDFEAAYDGPVIPGSPTNVPVDDLILCERCLEEAFVLLDPKGQMAELEKLRAQVDLAEAHIVSLERQVHSSQETINELVDHPIRRHSGKRGFQIEDKQVKDILEAKKWRRDQRARLKAARRKEKVDG